MKRLLVAGAASLAVFSTVYGLAASLGVESDSLGAGNDVVSECQTVPLTVSYVTEYTTTGYEVTGVTVGNVQDECHGMGAKVEVVGDNGAHLAEATTGAIPSTSSFSLDLDTEVLADGVKGVRLLITGPAAP